MKIGELFVDLDFRDGGAINKLTNFSLKFLALNTAASQVASRFDDLFGSVIDGVVEMENLNRVTGFSIERMQRWKAISEQNNVSFGDLIGSLKSLQSASAAIMLGGGNSAPFVQLGIDMTRPREAVELLDEIRIKISQINDIGLRRNLLQELGLSENLLILFEEFNGYFAENLQLTEAERNSVLELNREWIALKQTVGFGWDKVWAQSAEGVATFIKMLRGIVIEYSNVITQSESLGDGLVQVFETISERINDIAQDNAFISLLSSFKDAVYSLGEVLGTGAAYAVEGWNRFSEWGAQRANIDPTQTRADRLNQLFNNNVESNQVSNVNNSRSVGDININNNITSSRPVDRNMMSEVSNSTAQQIGQLGYLRGG